jgi:hypothetical protein
MDAAEKNFNKKEERLMEWKYKPYSQILLCQSSTEERRQTMPAGNGTGPMGAGPMTGRGMGYCAGYNAPGYAMGGGGFGRGLGRGMGRGMGFGFRNRFFAGWGNVPQAPAQPMNKKDQVVALKAQQTAIQQQIDTLEGQD